MLKVATMQKDSWSPQQYDKFKQQRSQPFYDLINLLQPVKDARVVDLGCGTGELTEELHRFLNAAHTRGIDNSEAMLAKAKAFESTTLYFEKGDIETWRDDRGVDVVFSNAAFQWCSNHRELFKRVTESLGPEGQLAVQMPMNQDYPTHVLASQMIEEPKWSGRVKGARDSQNAMLRVDEYASLLFKLGYKEQKVFLRVYDHILENREGVIEWVKGTLLTSFKGVLGEQDYKEFEQEYRERLFKILPDEKPFFYPFKRILMWGKR